MCAFPFSDEYPNAKELYIGDSGPFLYDPTEEYLDEDDNSLGINVKAIESQNLSGRLSRMQVTRPAEGSANNNEVATIQELLSRIWIPVEVANIDVCAELNTLSGITEGTALFAYERAGGSPNRFTIYSWDTDTPSGSAPQIVNGVGGRWVAGAGYGATVGSAGAHALDDHTTPYTLSDSLVIDSQVTLQAGAPQVGILGPVGTSDAAAFQLRLQSTGAFSTSPRSGVIITGKHDSEGTVGDFAAIWGGKENATDDNKQGYLAFGTWDSTLTTLIEQVRVDSGGRLGVGEATPTSKVSITRSNTDTTPLTGFSDYHLSIKNPNLTNGNWEGIVFRTNETGGSEFTAAAIAVVNNAHGANSVEGVMNFITVNGATAAVRMTIDNAGNIGIGGSPSVLLHAQSIATNPAIRIQNLTNDLGKNALIDLQVAGSTNGGGDPQIRYLLGGAVVWSHGMDNTDSDKFKISSGGLLGTDDRFVIDSAGNIGIRTATITRTLQVNGTIGWGDDGTTAELGRLTYTAVGGNPAIAAGASKGITFYTNNATTRAMDIASGGNVGIGTDSPGQLLHISKAGGGSSVSAKITNSSDTAGSDATLQIDVAGINGGDPKIIFTGPSVSAWVVGVDNNASDKFMIGTGIGVGTTPSLTITTGGAFGLGVTTPASGNKVCISGGVSIGSGVAGVTAAPTNGLLVEGTTKIGGTTANASAILDITSTAKGILIPRMNDTQRNAMTAVEGLIIWNTGDNALNYYDGSNWRELTGTTT
jgi:hypothetical protein